jgi:trehalose-6-phosphate synthase
VQTEVTLDPRKSNPIASEAHETAEVKDRIDPAVEKGLEERAQRWSGSWTRNGEQGVP